MANIREIAKMAKVSATTVSRVLNGYPYVSEDKRNAVLEAIERLNYARNINAVHLLRGKTNMVGVIVPFVNHPYFSGIMEGITEKALRGNVHLVLCQTNYEEKEEYKALEMLKEKQVDGLIICSKTLAWDRIEPYSSFGPIVACENAGRPAISSVYIDHYASFQFGIRHLIRQGHRRIGYCLGRANSASGERRRQAYYDALASIQEPVAEKWMFHNCYGIEDGVKVVRQLQGMDVRPSAFLVTSDQVAAGMMAEAGRQGVRVPEELAIIGFDNHPISKVLHITTIDNQLHEMGSRAFRILREQITGEREKPAHAELQFQLISRSTV